MNVLEDFLMEVWHVFVQQICCKLVIVHIIKYTSLHKTLDDAIVLTNVFKRLYHQQLVFWISQVMLGFFSNFVGTISKMFQPPTMCDKTITTNEVLDFK